MKPIIDPRRGDLEDDASSPKRRSLLSLAGSLLSEISFPKLITAWVLLLIAPCIAAWALSAHSFCVGQQDLGQDCIPVCRDLDPCSSSVCCSLSALRGKTAVPYRRTKLLGVELALARALLRGLTRRAAAASPISCCPRKASKTRRSRVRAITAAVAGIILCALALLALMLAWPSSRWVGTLSDLTSPHLLVPVALANSVVLIAVYLAASRARVGLRRCNHVAAPRFPRFRRPALRQAASGAWRICRTSTWSASTTAFASRAADRGRAATHGSSGCFSQLEALHATDPLDAILITGDMTDAGRSAEWAEFLDALAVHPRLAERVLMLPGNHDLNVVDRANPARLDLPTSPSKRLRQMRTLSAMAALQGTPRPGGGSSRGPVGAKLADVLEPHRAQIAEFADAGPFTSIHDARRPVGEGISDDSAAGPGRRARHHPVELQRGNAFLLHQCARHDLGRASQAESRSSRRSTREPAGSSRSITISSNIPARRMRCSERIGTTLINGSWFVRRLRPLAGRVVLMHGHRHIDWIGECAGLLIVSAPSPVMDATDDLASYFYIQTFALAPHGRLRLLPPQRITIAGEARGDE